MTERKRTKAEEHALAQLHDSLRDLELMRLDMVVQFGRLKFENVPPEWSVVEDAVRVRRKKVRINAAYDEDVAKFFRAMGHGYQARMNAVLRCYVYGILSREISSRRNQDWLGNEM